MDFIFGIVYEFVSFPHMINELQYNIQREDAIIKQNVGGFWMAPESNYVILE